MTVGLGWSESLSLCGVPVSFIVCAGTESMAQRAHDVMIGISLIVVSGTA